MLWLIYTRQGRINKGQNWFKERSMKARIRSFLNSYAMPVLVVRGFHNKNHRLGGLNNKNLFSHCSGGWKSKIKESAVLSVSPRPLSLNCKCPPPGCFLFSPHAIPVSLSLLIRTPVCLLLVPSLHHLHLDYLFRVPISKYSHSEG